MGALLADNSPLPVRSNARPKVAFGCGYNQNVEERKELPVDGVLGLGRGTLDIVSQLKQHRMITKNVIGHCFSIKGGGFLLIGVEKLPTSGVTWVPMVRGKKLHHYSPGPAKLYFDRNPLRVNPMEVIFDSGSTYTYFAAQPYQATLSAVHIKSQCILMPIYLNRDVKHRTRGMWILQVKNALRDPLKLVPDPALQTCNY